MWYTFDLTFLSCSLLSKGDERITNEVRFYLNTYSRPTCRLLSDEKIDEKGVYIFHNYEDIYYVGKTSRSFRQRFCERKGRPSASDQRIWEIIDRKRDYYLLIPTSFSNQLEAILLSQGIKGPTQKRELVALVDYQRQRQLVLNMLSTALNAPISIIKSIWSKVFLLKKIHNNIEFLICYIFWC